MKNDFVCERIQISCERQERRNKQEEIIIYNVDLSIFRFRLLLHVVPFCLWAFVNLSSRLKTYCIFCINWNSVLFSSVVFISFVGDNVNIPFCLHHNRRTLHQMLRALFDIVRLDVFFVDVAFSMFIFNLQSDARDVGEFIFHIWLTWQLSNMQKTESEWVEDAYMHKQHLKCLV